MNAKQLAEKLVLSFGRPEEVVSLLADDVIWTLHTGSAPPGGTHEGKQAVQSLMETVFGGIYSPESVVTDIEQLVGDKSEAAIRFRLKTTTTWGARYDNSYAIFISSSNGKIDRCFELLDSLSATEQLADSAPDDLSAG